MRKLISFNMITLDGFFAGPNGEIEWHNVDDEFNKFAIDQLNEVGALLFGRVTYEMMASYWPTSEAIADDTAVAEMMNSLPKVVFSRTIVKAGWQNTRLVQHNASEEVALLKQQPGKDLFIFGSADLTASLINARLVDEFRVIINPTALGRGQPLFKDLQRPVKFKLLKSRPFQNGNVLMYYQTEQV